MREVSIDKAAIITQTVTSTSYRIDDETMVELDNVPESLERIEQEKQNAKASLVLGVPSLFSFDVVRCNGRYGIIYEQFHAKTLGHQIMDDPENFDHYLDLYVQLSKKMHAIHVPEGSFRSVKDVYRKNVQEMGDLLTEEEKRKCNQVIDAVPDGDSYIPAGYQPSRVFYKDDQLFLNTFDHTGYGHPLFALGDEIVSIKFSAEAPGLDPKFLYMVVNMDQPTARKFWHDYIVRYFNFSSEEQFEKMDKLLSFFGLLKIVLASVLAPNISQAYRQSTLDNGRKNFFPYVDYMLDALKNPGF